MQLFNTQPHTHQQENYGRNHEEGESSKTNQSDTQQQNRP
jgi:hypothetical protein